MKWTNVDSLNSVVIPFEIQSGDLASNVICEPDNVSINVNNNQRLVITNTGYSSLRSTSTNTRIDIDVGSIYMSASGNVVFYVFGSSSRMWSPDTSTQLTLENGQGVKINNQYYLPTSDGTLNQYIASNGAGVASWQTLPKPGLFSQTSVITVANTNTETNLNGVGVGSLIIQPNYITTGTSLLYKAGGVFRDLIINQTFRFRFRMNGVSILDTGLLTLTNVNTSRPWTIETQMTYYGGNMISNFSFSYNNGGSTLAGFQSQGSSPFNPLILNTLQVSVQWSTVSINNTITTNYSTLTKIY